MNNIIGTVVSFIFVFAVILAAKGFERFGKEASRKFIHIAVSNWWFIAMAFFKDPVWAALVPFAFVIINFLSYKFGIVDAMERKEGKGDLGTVYYALSLLLLAMFSFGGIHQPWIGGVGILVMGYGDGLAAIIGKAFGKRKFNLLGAEKSIVGSVTMLAASLVVTMIFFGVQGVDGWMLKALVTAAAATAVEAVSPYGLDNLAVPLSTALLARLLSM